MAIFNSYFDITRGYHRGFKTVYKKPTSPRHVKDRPQNYHAMRELGAEPSAELGDRLELSGFLIWCFSWGLVWFSKFSIIWCLHDPFMVVSFENQTFSCYILNYIYSYVHLSQPGTGNHVLSIFSCFSSFHSCYSSRFYSSIANGCRYVGSLQEAGEQRHPPDAALTQHCVSFMKYLDPP